MAKQKFGTRTGKHKFKARAGKYKFGTRAGKHKLGARIGKYKLGQVPEVGVKQRGGDLEIQRPQQRTSLFLLQTRLT